MPEDPPRATEGYKRNFFFFSGLKAHRGAGRNVKSHASCYFPVKCEGAIDFEEMIVTADLNGTIATVFHQHGSDATSNVRFNLFRFDEVFTWPHGLEFEQSGQKDLPLRLSPDRIVNGDELSAVRKGSFDLHVMDHLGYAIHDVLAFQDGCAKRHDLRD
jgi:hypothetical protein